MQNKPNLTKSQMNVSNYITREYEVMDTWSSRKNKPKQTQFIAAKPDQTQPQPPFFTREPTQPSESTTVHSAATNDIMPFRLVFRTLIGYTSLPVPMEHRKNRCNLAI